MKKKIFMLSRGGKKKIKGKSFAIALLTDVARCVAFMLTLGRHGHGRRWK